MPNRPACLIVTTAAAEFAEEIARHESSIPVKCCLSAERALSEYADETIVFGNPAMIGEVLQEMPGVDWVQSSWAGVTPLIEHPRRDYVLTGVKDVFGPQMSEYVLGYLLAHQLKIRRRQEEQRAHNWFRDSSGMLEGKCLGIMGTGSIGQHIAHSASNFGMAVTGLSRSGSPAPGFTDVLPVAKLHEFLEQCDYLVSVLPDTASTECLLDATALAKLPANGYFVNVGRSNVVDDAALIDALQNATLAGAALDVFDQEPIPRDSPLWDTPNLSITAHIAAISQPDLVVPIFVDNYRRYAKGQPLKHVIDFAAGY
jgi:phosphoglycerate dehydrogenase-like enzyme